jgi:hypothetical protein
MKNHKEISHRFENNGQIKRKNNTSRIKSEEMRMKARNIR